MMKRKSIWDNGAGRWGLGLCLLLFGIGVDAQSGPPGETETGRVVAAHQAIESGQIDVRFAQYFSYPDETEFATAQYRVVFDRQSRRIRIDRPGYTLVCDGTDILLVAGALPRRHLRVPLEDAFTYERLVEVFPDLAQPAAPALVMALSDSPIQQLSGGQTDQLTRVPVDDALGKQLIKLDLAAAQGEAHLVFDAKRRLLQSMLTKIDQAQLAGSGLDAVRLHYEVKWSKVGEPVDDAEFELDLKRSHEMTTLAAFLSPNGGNAQPGPGGQGGGVPAGGSLVGMPLPEIELELLGSDKKVKLSDLDEGVVILECFATWSKTSVLDLPALADFKGWCNKEKHDVQVYAIAVGDQPEHTTKWLAALEKTAKREVDLPMLMDTTTNAAIAMKLPTVPRTLIVVDGRVVDVFGGIKPTYLDDLKEGMPRWLEKASPKEGADANRPESDKAK